MDLKAYLAWRGKGTAARLAVQIGVSPVLISQWRTERRTIPGDRVIPIARATGWRVTPHELRPDLYPNAGDGVPVDVDFSEGGAA